MLIVMWIVYAGLASMLWGLTYVLHEQLYRVMSIYTTIALHTGLIALTFLGVALAKGVFKADIAAVTASSYTIGLAAASVAVFMLAELFIALSIVSKNATLAGLIEISYPLFIALFAYAIFRESALNWGIAAGGALIMLGVMVVFSYSR